MTIDPSGDAFGPGSRASVEPPSGVSPVPASIPIATSPEAIAAWVLTIRCAHAEDGCDCWRCQGAAVLSQVATERDEARAVKVSAEPPPIAEGWTDEELDRRHDDVVARFPGGLTPRQFRYLALESARADGRIHAPSLAPFTTGMSLLIGMHIEGLIENRGGGYDKPFRWCITEKGRAALAQGIVTEGGDALAAPGAAQPRVEPGRPEGDAP